MTGDRNAATLVPPGRSEGKFINYVYFRHPGPAGRLQAACRKILFGCHSYETKTLVRTKGVEQAKLHRTFHTLTGKRRIVCIVGARSDAG